MRTIGVVAVVLCLAFSFAVIGGSGVGDAIFGQSGNADPGLEDFVDEQAEEAEVGEDEGEGIGADVEGSDEPTTVGLVFNGISFIISFVAAVAIFPIALIGLGFPAWFAVPLGGIMQIVAVVGAIQFATGREWI